MKHSFFGIDLDLSNYTPEERAELQRWFAKETVRPLPWWVKLILVTVILGATFGGLLLLSNSFVMIGG